MKPHEHRVMTSAEKAEVGIITQEDISMEGWPEVAYFTNGEKVEKVTGWMEIQKLAREDNDYLQQYHGTREAAEEYIEMTYHPVEYAYKQFRAGEITYLEFEAAVGPAVARRRADDG